MSAEIDFINAMKRLNKRAIENDKPTDLVFGTIESVSPLKVRVNQKLLLTKEFLLLSENVSNFKTIIDGKAVTVNNSLKTGEKVAMLRLNGGQTFYILGRVI